MPSRKSAWGAASRLPGQQWAEARPLSTSTDHFDASQDLARFALPPLPPVHWPWQHLRSTLLTMYSSQAHPPHPSSYPQHLPVQAPPPLGTWQTPPGESGRDSKGGAPIQEGRALLRGLGVSFAHVLSQTVQAGPASATSKAFGAARVLCQGSRGISWPHPPSCPQDTCKG